LLKEGLVKISGANIVLDKEVASKFTKSERGYTLPINSGTLEMNDSKIIILAD
jgi:F-type H+-transporting ATPase subunit epsilon